ncbi:hypothetical protein DRQ12_08770 [candidate division KSB1 bacterium]|nr:MAG: hypothetical protein DRQ12_08770 [candidate division KSB1 bacterium]
MKWNDPEFGKLMKSKKDISSLKGLRINGQSYLYKHFVPIGTDKSLVRDDMVIEKLPPKDIRGCIKRLF